MTATIVDAPRYAEGYPVSGDRVTVSDAVENGPAMAAHLGRDFSPASRAHLGALWGNPLDNWRERDAVSGNRRMAAVGGTLVTDDLYRRNPDGSITAL